MAFATDSLQSDTQYLTVSSTAATKGGELRRKRAGEEKGGEEDDAETFINEEKCIVPVSGADGKRQDKVQGRLLGH